MIRTGYAIKMVPSELAELQRILLNPGIYTNITIETSKHGIDAGTVFNANCADLAREIASIENRDIDELYFYI